MQKRKDVPKNARLPPEGRNIRSRSETAFPVWDFGPRAEGPVSEKKQAPKKD